MGGCLSFDSKKDPWVQCLRSCLFCQGADLQGPQDVWATLSAMVTTFVFAKFPVGLCFSFVMKTLPKMPNGFSIHAGLCGSSCRRENETGVNGNLGQRSQASNLI